MSLPAAIARRLRRGNACLIYGLMGAGKTLLATAIAVELQKRYNLPIAANISYTFEHERIRKYSQLETIRDAILVLDELGIILNSRKFASNVNLHITESLLLWRKRNCIVLATAQQPRLVDVRLVENASHHIFCEAAMSNYTKVTFLEVRLTEMKAIFENVSFDRSKYYPLGWYDSYETDVSLEDDLSPVKRK